MDSVAQRFEAMPLDMLAEGLNRLLTRHSDVTPETRELRRKNQQAAWRASKRKKREAERNEQ